MFDNQYEIILTTNSGCDLNKKHSLTKKRLIPDSGSSLPPILLNVL